MSTISASTTSTTAYKVTADTTGTLVLQTGSTPTTAVTIGSDQVVTFANQPTYSGGTANGVAYLNGSKVLTTGSALVFDGTKLAIGKTSPTVPLSFADSAGTAGTANKISLYWASGETYALYGFGVSANQLDYVTGDSHVFYRRNTNASTVQASINSAGQFYVYSSTGTALSVSNTSLNSASTSGVTGLYFGDAASGCIFVERSKQTANTAQLRLYTEHGYSVQTLAAYFYNTVGYQGNNSTTWSTTSDERVKTNIRPISGALEKICSLNGVHFEYKNALGKTKTSFLAQQFEQVLPGHVHEIPAPDDLKEFVGEDGMMKALDPELIPYLVEAIKEQQAVITQLQADIETLKGAA